MEPPQPSAGAPLSPRPVISRATLPRARPGWSNSKYKPNLTVIRRADRRLVWAAVAGGVAFDITARSGLATVGAMAWVGIVAAGLLSGGRARGVASHVAVLAGPVLAASLAVRSSPWVSVPTAVAIGLLFVVGASLGADGGGLDATFPALAARMAVVGAHLALAAGMLQTGGEPETTGDGRRTRGAAFARGALLAVPAVFVVGLLLASADPIFRSWFDLPAVAQHLVLASIGAMVVLGLCRAASARQPSPELGSAPALGTVEAACVLGGVCALYATFVIAQFVALSAGGRHVLATQGLTYAQYARSGFFQLLACAALTLVLLLSVRACANPSHPVLIGLAELTVALTIGVVLIAMRRLQLYEAAYGLTMLRLASLAAAAWIGIVFVLVGLAVPRRRAASRWLPTVVLLSGLVAVGIWCAVNPASIVATTNVRRALRGQRFDVDQAASLGPDAVPPLVDSLRHLGVTPATELRQALCARLPSNDAGIAYNAARAGARKALLSACHPAAQ